MVCFGDLFFSRNNQSIPPSIYMLYVAKAMRCDSIFDVLTHCQLSVECACDFVVVFEVPIVVFRRRCIYLCLCVWLETRFHVCLCVFVCTSILNCLRASPFCMCNKRRRRWQAAANGPIDSRTQCSNFQTECIGMRAKDLYIFLG